VLVTATAAPAGSAAPRHGTPLLVLYGSNLGTAEEVARRLAEAGEAGGFAVRVAALDEYAGRLPTEGAVVIASASYNGTPPDNAARFCTWLREAEPVATSLAGVRYTVFGCGNRDWASTFQAVPRMIDERLAALGAERVYARGEGDAREDFDGQFQAWQAPLLGTVAKALGVVLAAAEAAEPAHLTVETVEGGEASPFVDTLGARALRVLVNRELHIRDGADGSTRSTRHLELDLPEGVSYRAGDHLGVIPRNADALVERAAARFGLDPGASIRLRLPGGRKSFLPVDQPIPLRRLLADYVELQDPATRKQIQAMADHTECPWTRPRLLALAEDEGRFREEVLARRKSILDLLEEYPACQLPFNRYLEMLPPLRPRYYSISSSPLRDPRRCSITVALVEGSARSGRGTFQGVCSGHLRRHEAGDRVHAFVKDTRSAFRLPERASTPIVMIGPGTGLAPFRGFLQERAAQRERGETIGPALLFFGCRHPRQDFIYEDELRALAEQGVVQLFTCFSRVPGEQKTYVQDQVRRRRAEVWALLEQGAVVYVCGDASRMAPDVRRAFAAIHREQTRGDERAAEAWLDRLTAEGRYLVDVWAAG
jgi:cytochrome P450/NADPH-cytochrome P450 reductase